MPPCVSWLLSSRIYSVQIVYSHRCPLCLVTVLCRQCVHVYGMYVCDSLGADSQGVVSKSALTLGLLVAWVMSLFLSDCLLLVSVNFRMIPFELCVLCAPLYKFFFPFASVYLLSVDRKELFRWTQRTNHSKESSCYWLHVQHTSRKWVKLIMKNPTHAIPNLHPGTSPAQHLE